MLFVNLVKLCGRLNFYFQQVVSEVFLASQKKFATSFPFTIITKHNRALFVEATDKSTSSRLSKLHGHGNSRQQEYPMIVYTPLAQAHSGLGLRFSEEVAEANESGNVAAFKVGHKTLSACNSKLANKYTGFRHKSSSHKLQCASV